MNSKRSEVKTKSATAPATVGGFGSDCTTGEMLGRFDASNAASKETSHHNMNCTRRGDLEVM